MIQLTEKLFCVEVPSDCDDYEITRCQDNYNLRQIHYASDKYNGYQNYDRENLGEFNFKILGEVTKDEISFDVEIYVKDLGFSDKKSFEDYQHKWLCFNNPKESFRSLLQSKGIYFENPMGKLETCCSVRDCGCMGMPTNISSMEEYEEWQESENKVIKGKLIILINYEDII